MYYPNSLSFQKQKHFLLNTHFSIFERYFEAYWLQAELEFYQFFNVLCEHCSEEPHVSFYQSSKNNLYIVPQTSNYFLLSSTDSSLQQYVSADAAGIACTLYTLNFLLNICKKQRHPDYLSQIKFNRHFLHLTEYAKAHAEKEAILSVIS